MSSLFKIFGVKEPREYNSPSYFHCITHSHFCQSLFFRYHYPYTFDNHFPPFSNNPNTPFLALAFLHNYGIIIIICPISVLSFRLPYLIPAYLRQQKTPFLKDVFNKIIKVMFSLIAQPHKHPSARPKLLRNAHLFHFCFIYRSIAIHF